MSSTLSGLQTTQGSTTPSGGLTLVTATFVLACGNTLPVFARLSLTPLVPEPSTLVLVAAAAGLIWVLRRR